MAMGGRIILAVFFLMFTIASLLAPCPMFPGNFLCSSIGNAVSGYSLYVSAFVNGLFYGLILWLVFVGISRSLESEK
jgi:hypothetical protein